MSAFHSDGCSLFPDQSVIDDGDWCDCCVMHDVAYWRGGTKAERKQADKALRSCVLAKTDDPVLAKVMYDGVRFGGSPYFFNWYRWGYGWSYQRKYEPLSSEETEQVRKRWAEFLQEEKSFSCPVTSLKALSVE